MKSINCIAIVVTTLSFVTIAETVPMQSQQMFFPGTARGKYFGDSAPEYFGCASGDTLAVSSKKVTAFPSALEDDILFYLDASDRTGWEFAPDSSVKVTKIPSKIGPRYLTMEISNWNGGDGWGTSSDREMLSPELVYDDKLSATVLDFGTRGSRRAMCFDRNGETEYVNMTGIGTIVTLRETQNGGGWLLGGGGTGGYGWHRGTSDQSTSELVAEYDSPFYDGNAQTSVRDARYYADGQLTAGISFKFTGGWDLFTMQPKVADCNALGLGMGDARSWACGRASGGFKVAEMIIFNRLLTKAEILDVEEYLRQKWLHRHGRDYNGRTDVEYLRPFHVKTPHDLAGISVGVDMPAGETLTVRNLEGGRSHATPTTLDDYGLTKTGAGTLALVDASGYGNKIDIKEGALAFPAKPVPSSLGSFKIAERFDASAAAGTITADANGNVVRWENSSTQKYKDQEMFAGVPADATAPKLVRDALGDGLDVVDLGAYDSGMYLSLMTNSASPGSCAQNCATVLAVIDVSEGGGNLMSGLISRVGDSFVNSLNGFQDSYDARYYVNGRKTTRDKGYPYPGWVVLAMQGKGASSQYFGFKDGFGTGGLRIAELIVCSGYLTEEQMLDASAYLAAKWLGRTLPGYVATKSRTCPDVQRLATSSGPVTVDVATGHTVKVNPIGALNVIKTGEGTLEVVASATSLGSMSVKSGGISYVKHSEPESAESYAASPALHIDPSQANTMKIVQSGSDKFVRWIADADGGENALYVPENSNDASPLLNETDMVNGLSVLDFSSNSRYLAFVKGIDSVRSVFVVFGSQTSGSLNPTGPLLGWASKVENVNRNGSYATGSNVPDFQGGEGTDLSLGSAYVSPGMLWFTNGVSATRSDKRIGGYELIEAHPVVPAHAGALMRYGGSSSWCARYGEILVYDRELTEREKVATRNYLLKKWFPNAPRAALPAAAESRISLELLSVADGVAIGGETKVSVASLAGEGEVTIRAGESFEVSDGSAFTGTVKVASGTLSLKGDYVVGGWPADHRLLHFDASEGVVTKEVGGRSSVVEWVSKVGGYKAVPFGPAGMATNNLVYLSGTDCPFGYAGSVVDFPDRSCMRIVDAGGNGVQLKGAKSMFWVLGSKRGGGWLVGGGDDASNNFDWMRANDGKGYNDPSQPLFHTAYIAEAIKNPAHSHWYVNGSLVHQTATASALSGAWDIVSGHFQGSYSGPGIMGLACDARRFDQTNDSNIKRCGCQALAELIVYDRLLSDNERRAVESYLNAKWGGHFEGYRSVEGNGMCVELADNAALNVADETSQYVASFVGGGQVKGTGTLQIGETFNVVVRDGVAEKIESEGVLSFGANVTIVFDGLPLTEEALQGKAFTVASAAGGYEGLDALNAALQRLALPVGIRARARVVRGDLVLTFSSGGIVLIVR